MASKLEHVCWQTHTYRATDADRHTAESIWIFTRAIEKVSVFVLDPEDTTLLLFMFLSCHVLLLRCYVVHCSCYFFFFVSVGFFRLGLACSISPSHTHLCIIPSNIGCILYPVPYSRCLICSNIISLCCWTSLIPISLTSNAWPEARKEGRTGECLIKVWLFYTAMSQSPERPERQPKRRTKHAQTWHQQRVTRRAETTVTRLRRVLTRTDHRHCTSSPHRHLARSIALLLLLLSARVCTAARID